jgi:hypothetical protein
MKTKITTTPLQMPLEVTLEPTALDRRMGVCGSPDKCMYNLTARRDYFPTATHIRVQPGYMVVTQDGEYHYYGMPLKGTATVAKYDKEGRNLSDADLKKGKITLRWMWSRKCSYKGTAAQKEYHRKKSARYRADPNHVRPDSHNTIRMQVARTHKIKTKTVVIADL